MPAIEKEKEIGGSRHAMEAAIKYGVERYVMFNKAKDEDNIKFGLNKDFLRENKAKVLTHGSINEIKAIRVLIHLTKPHWI